MDAAKEITDVSINVTYTTIPEASHGHKLHAYHYGTYSSNDVRIWMGHALENKKFHIFILFLILLDFGIVMAEIAVSLYTDSQCHDDAHHEEPVALHILAIITLMILSIFLLEIVLKLCCFGYQYYTKHFLHAFDAMVIIVAFLITAITHQTEAEEIAGVLIVFRFWRVIRIIDAVAGKLPIYLFEVFGQF